MIPQTTFSYWMHRNIKWVIVGILVGAFLLFIFKKLFKRH